MQYSHRGFTEHWTIVYEHRKTFVLFSWPEIFVSPLASALRLTLSVKVWDGVVHGSFPNILGHKNRTKVSSILLLLSLSDKDVGQKFLRRLHCLLLNIGRCNVAPSLYWPGQTIRKLNAHEQHAGTGRKQTLYSEQIRNKGRKTVNGRRCAVSVLFWAV